MLCNKKSNIASIKNHNSMDSYIEEELVSVITPCYNSARYISQTIESVLSQTYQNWEMIIVDGCSSDNTVQIVEEYIAIDDRIRLIKLETNSGVAVDRNRAIEEAKGWYIAFLDSDDIWLPQKLEKQIRFMIENSQALCYSSYYLIDEHGLVNGVFMTKEFATYEGLLKTSHIGALTAVYDACKIGKRYMQNVGHEDYALWLNILKDVGTAKGILEPLAKYRRHNRSVSSNKAKAAQMQWNIYRNIEKFSLIKSLYYFLHYVYFGFFKYR